MAWHLWEGSHLDVRNVRNDVVGYCKKLNNKEGSSANFWITASKKNPRILVMWVSFLVFFEWKVIYIHMYIYISMKKPQGFFHSFLCMLDSTYQIPRCITFWNLDPGGGDVGWNHRNCHQVQGWLLGSKMKLFIGPLDTCDGMGLCGWSLN